jgi:hypothetical protein
MNCPHCKSELKPLFTSYYCPNNCDKNAEDGLPKVAEADWYTWTAPFLNYKVGDTVPLVYVCKRSLLPLVASTCNFYRVKLLSISNDDLVEAGTKDIFSRKDYCGIDMEILEVIK